MNLHNGAGMLGCIKIPYKGEKHMPTEIDVNCQYLIADGQWLIQIKIPCGDDPQATGKRALVLADEFLKITKEKLEIESKQS